MELEARVEDRVLKPVDEVFAAIVDPSEMSKYFITGASGPMMAGRTVEWEFGDVGAKVAVDVIEVVENRRIACESTVTGPRTRVTFTLEAVDPRTSLLSITEAGWPMDPEGVKRALGQTAGWTYFLCCLKAHVQYGVNLRRGLARRLTD
jgi:uncharacterized protein YndB with AHSA1/START domain